MNVQTISVQFRDPHEQRRQYALATPPDTWLIRAPARLVDDATGEVVAAISYVDRQRARRLGTMLTGKLPWQGGQAGSQEARLSGFQPKFMAWGVVPPQPLRRRYGCSVCAFDQSHPELAGLLRETVTEAWVKLSDLAPAVAAAHETRVREKINADWLMGRAPFTSGVVNNTAALPYHCDAGNLKDAWSVMVMMRRHLNGGNLHLPAYGVWLACDDGDTILFKGQSDLHAVTPFEYRARDAYRFSVVAYAKAAIRHCGPASEESERAAVAATAANRRKAR